MAKHHSKTSQIMRVGTVRLKLREDNGDEWKYDLPKVVFDPDSPYSLLGIPFLGEYFARGNPKESQDEELLFLSRSSKSHFTWDHGKHERHFVRGDSSLPELICNEGQSYFTSFCTRIRNWDGPSNTVTGWICALKYHLKKACFKMQSPIIKCF